MKRVLATLALTTTALAQSGERLRPDHLPTPFSAEQIRKACGEGRTTTWVIKMAGKVEQSTFTFLGGDKKNCKFTISKFKEDGTPKGKPESMQLTWKQLQAHGLQPEEWGGETVMCPVSAITGEGVDDLLENLSVVAEMAELTANPFAPARGRVISVGNGRLLDDGSRGEIQVQVGDRVIFSSYAGETFKVDQDELLLMREEDILAVTED